MGKNLKHEKAHEKFLNGTLNGLPLAVELNPMGGLRVI
jgi:hypothetical protein